MTLEPQAGIVGVCGMGVQFPRQQELLAYYRSRGHYVVAGGSYASLCPEQYTTHADTVAAGESEYIWKEFCDHVWIFEARMLSTASPATMRDVRCRDRMEPSCREPGIQTHGVPDQQKPSGLLFGRTNPLWIAHFVALGVAQNKNPN